MAYAWGQATVTIGKNTVNPGLRIVKLNDGMPGSGKSNGNGMFDAVLLRSFVAVAESASFTRAGERVHLTQSTISQQIRRLESQCGCALLDRSGRYVATTAEGERLLGYARRILDLMDEALEQVRGSAAAGEIRVGVPEDFAADTLTPALAGFADAYPEVRLEVTSGLSHELWRQFQSGELDVVLIKQRTGSAPGVASWAEPLCWVDSRHRPAVQRDPVPLVVFPIGGLYRSEMIHALEASGRRWRIGYVSASLASLHSAVSDGLGLSLLPCRLVGSQQRRLGQDEGCAPVPDLELTLHARAEASAHTRDLVERMIALCGQAMAS